jgi:hypothetical protein
MHLLLYFEDKPDVAREVFTGLRQFNLGVEMHVVRYKDQQGIERLLESQQAGSGERNSKQYVIDEAEERVNNLLVPHQHPDQKAVFLVDLSPELGTGNREHGLVVVKKLRQRLRPSETIAGFLKDEQYLVVVVSVLPPTRREITPVWGGGMDDLEIQRLSSDASVRYVLDERMRRTILPTADRTHEAHWLTDLVKLWITG